MPSFGSGARLMMTVQASMGSTAPNSWFIVPFASEDLTLRVDELTDDSISGYADESDRITGMTGVEGNIEANFHPIVGGMFLRGVFGTYSGIAYAGSAFQHTFTPQTVSYSDKCTLPYYAFVVDAGETGVTSHYLLQDCFFNTMELNFTAGQFVRGTVGVVGKTGALTASGTAQATAWPSGISPFRWSTVSVSLFGAAFQRFHDFRISFNNNIGMQDRIDGSDSHTFFFREGFRQFARITGTADIAQADFLKLKNETEGKFEVYCVGKTAICSGTNESLFIQIPRFVYTLVPFNISGPDIITVTVEGRGQYSTGSGHVAKITLVNTFDTADMA